MKRFILRRVEKWINTLPNEFKTREYIQASLGLLRVIGIPVNFSSVLKSWKVKENNNVVHWSRVRDSAEKARLLHQNRKDEVEELQRLLD